MDDLFIKNTALCKQIKFNKLNFPKIDFYDEK